MRLESTRPPDPAEESAYQAGYAAGVNEWQPRAEACEGQSDRRALLLGRAAELLASDSGFDARAADALIAEIRAEIGE